VTAHTDQQPFAGPFHGSGWAFEGRRPWTPSLGFPN
jgi:hypothetical protein